MLHVVFLAVFSSLVACSKDKPALPVPIIVYRTIMLIVIGVLIGLCACAARTPAPFLIDDNQTPRISQAPKKPEISETPKILEGPEGASFHIDYDYITPSAAILQAVLKWDFPQTDRTIIAWKVLVKHVSDKNFYNDSYILQTPYKVLTLSPQTVYEVTISEKYSDGTDAVIKGIFRSKSTAQLLRKDKE